MPLMFVPVRKCTYMTSKVYPCPSICVNCFSTFGVDPAKEPFVQMPHDNQVFMALFDIVGQIFDRTLQQVVNF